MFHISKDWLNTSHNFLHALKVVQCEMLVKLCLFFILGHTLYTSRKPLQHLLATGVPSCEEPGSAHEQTCKISREELPHPNSQRQNELRRRNFFASLPLWWRLLISVDPWAEWGWPDTLGTIQGGQFCSRILQSCLFLFHFKKYGL